MKKKNAFIKLKEMQFASPYIPFTMSLNAS